MVAITGELGRDARVGGVGANPGVTPAGGSEGALTVGLGGLPEPGQRRSMSSQTARGGDGERPQADSTNTSIIFKFSSVSTWF